MSDPKQRTTIRDLARKRWKYLFARAGTSTLWCYGMLLTVASAIVSIACIISLLIFRDGLWYDGFFSVAAVLGALVTALVSFIGFCNLREAKHISRLTAYVPPVHEQIAALPAEEVLVRGAEHPEAVASELLRPTNEVSNSATEELLRPGIRPGDDE